jgi:recombination DNA repair RAD52 pathway protein
MSEDADKAVKGASTYERLSARFPTEVHKRVNKGGGDQTYVPASDVIGRLNEVFGILGWSFQVIREGFTETEAWVLGELTVYPREDGVVVRQQYGNEPITMGKAARPTTDLLKKAGTDALKKCATLVGVALYLYDEDERNEVEQEMREAKRPKPPAPATPKVAAAAVVTGADPTVLKTKAELAADLRKGIEYARGLGLDVEDVDPAPLNRAQIEDTIGSLRQMCRDVLAEQRRQGMVS